MIAPWLPATSIGLLLSFVLILWPSTYLNIIVISSPYHKIDSHFHLAPTLAKNYSNLFNNQQSSENRHNFQMIHQTSDSYNSTLPSYDNILYLNLLPFWMLNSPLTEMLTLNYWPISPLLICLYMLPMMCQNIKRMRSITILGLIPVAICLIRLTILYGYKSLSLRIKQQPLYTQSSSSLSTNVSGSSVYLPDVSPEQKQYTPNVLPIHNKSTKNNVPTFMLLEDARINQVSC